jgi:hypothetical protein
MYCYNCIYYKQGPFDNECKAFGWENFRPDENCHLVDDSFNLIRDDEGGEWFQSKEETLKRIKKNKL